MYQFTVVRSFVFYTLLTMPGASADETVTDLCVMSFNIRYGSAEDGPNDWDHRKGLVIKTITESAPDLLGTQETLAFQCDYLTKNLPEHDVWAGGREDGQQRGEMMAVYYRRDRFEVLDRGHFWLSTTPDVVGSKSWDSSLPRMVSWVKLRDRCDPSSLPIAFFNTHFDYRGTTARLESARLVRQYAEKQVMDSSIIVAGDFNASQGSPPYQMLFAMRDGRSSPLIDSYRQIHPQRSHAEGTYHGFALEATSGPRIDWIGLSRDWQIKQATIDRSSQDGRLPSDHYPVTVIVCRNDP